MYRRIVVVGGSLAGLRAASTLRRLGYDGSLTMVDGEAAPAYDRPPLSKGYLTGAQSRADIDLGGGALDATWARGIAVRSLDATRHRLTLADGSDLPYDALVIASGAGARRPAWANTRGTHVLRTIEDATSLHHELLRGPKVVVAGGGFIGCEVASSARSLGCDVTLVHSGAVLLHRVLGVAAGAHVDELHRRNGVRVVAGAAVTRVLGQQRVEGVCLDTGESLPADVVVAGLGAVPNTAWLRGSGITVDDGVVCDASLRTSVPDVVAAGDVASWPNPLAGGAFQRIEHWTNAAAQGVAAARTLLRGERAPAYSAVPYFWSDQHGIRIQSVGWPEWSSEQPLLDERETGIGAAEFYRTGTLVGAVTVDDAARLAGYRARITTAASQETSVGAGQPAVIR